MKRSCVAFFLVIVAWASICGSAHASLFFGDEFNYPNGDLTIYNGAGANVSGGLWVPHSGTANPTSVVVSGGQAILEQGNPASEDVSRSLGTTQAGGTFYYAAVVTVMDERAAPATEIINEDYFIHFRDNTTTNFNARTLTLRPNNALDNATKFTFGIAPTSVGSGSIKWASDLNYGQQYTIVASYEILTGKSQLWVDPVDSSSTNVSITVASASLIQSQFLAMRQDFVSSNVGANRVLVDCVAAGDTFDDVLAACTPVIPEPTSVSLALLGACGLFARRRRA
ncbi:MAG: PEP-CTERM sorting domain-containing protein [Bythopirellula sp.]|nr:PEP-CTERM sorting domain-containing protein [Bythopirellula sp.]